MVGVNFHLPLFLRSEVFRLISKLLKNTIQSAKSFVRWMVLISAERSFFVGPELEGGMSGAGHTCLRMEPAAWWRSEL